MLTEQNTDLRTDKESRRKLKEAYTKEAEIRKGKHSLH